MLNGGLGLGFVFTASDLASGVISRVERSFLSLDRKVGLGTDRIKSSFRELGVGLSLMTAGAVMVGGAFALADKAGEFEQSIAAVAAVSGATAIELDQLRDAAIDAGIATQFSPTEATVGLKELAQAGFNASESMKLLIPVLDLACGSLGELSPAQAAGLASQALKAFSIDADDAALAVDRMLQAVNVFALNASELPMALGNASRGAQALHQSLSETLISLGLVKNIIPGVERASTGVAVAMERMVDPKTQAALKGLGVEVVDSTGHFRNFLDVIGDLMPALGQMTEAKRSAYLLDTFGHHALGGIQAVMEQLTKGIKTNANETVKGAEAVAYLRQQFDGAGGTAAMFREKMLDTFAGQKQLLRGSVETLAIVLGQPFERVFKPILSTVLDGLNGILTFVRTMPMSLKRGFATFIVVAGAILSVVGAAIAAKAAFVLLLIGLKAAGITIGGLLAVLAPAVVLIGAIAIAAAGLYLAFQKNLGGIGDFAARTWQTVSLFFRGLKQLIEEGGIWGSVREELNRVENQGIKNFLIDVYLWANRIRTFFAGIATGFANGVEAAKPSIEAFLGALKKLGAALGILSERDAPETAGAKFAAFGATGERVGLVLGQVFDLLIQGLTGIADTTRGVVTAWRLMKPVAQLLWNAFDMVGVKLAETIAMLTGGASATRESGDGWVALGKVVAFVAGLIINAIAWIVAAVAGLIAIASGVIGAVAVLFSGLADVVTGVVWLIGGLVTGDWKDVWTGMKLIAFGVIDAIIGVVLELVGAIGGAIDAMAGMVGKTTGIQKAVRDYKDSVHRDMAKSFGVESLTFTPVRPANATGGAPAMTPASGPMPAVAAMQSTAPAASPTFTPANAAYTPAPPLVVNVQVDGQTVAKAVHKASSENASQSFSPVPSY